MHNNSEIVELEDKLRLRNHKVAKLHDENNLELELLRAKQKQLMRADQIRKSRDPALRNYEQHRDKIAFLEAKVKE